MNVKTIISYIAVALLAAFCGYCYGIRDNGTPADEVREQLNNAQNQQHQITNGLGDAEGTIKESGRIIDECQSILRAVRSQPKS